VVLLVFLARTLEALELTLYFHQSHRLVAVAVERTTELVEHRADQAEVEQLLMEAADSPVEAELQIKVATAAVAETLKEALILIIRLVAAVALLELVVMVLVAHLVMAEQA
jgi:hypothetical protein